MKVLWKGSPRSAKQVIEQLSSCTEWKPATIKTSINRLICKGVLRFKKTGKFYLYSPAYTEAEFSRIEVERFLQRVLDGSPSLLLSHIIRSKRLKQSELDSLAMKLLREGKED
jgi:BlaI family penicillinase repressor